MQYDVFSYDPKTHDGGKEFDFDAWKFEHAVMDQQQLFELIQTLLDHKAARLVIGFEEGRLEVKQRYSQIWTNDKEQPIKKW